VRYVSGEELICALGAKLYEAEGTASLPDGAPFCL
jgi:hypothetical protein